MLKVINLLTQIDILFNTSPIYLSLIIFLIFWTLGAVVWTLYGLPDIIKDHFKDDDVNPCSIFNFFWSSLFIFGLTFS